MNPEENVAPTVEQSWIVLDEHGWGAGSRPPTASPTRMGPPLREEDDDEHDSIRRRLGMDSDVRQALELAEKSLELAGSADEFSSRSQRTSSEDDVFAARSPMVAYVAKNAWSEELIREDRYNGRAPPVVKRSSPISTDLEHVAFSNVKMVSSPSIEMHQKPLDFDFQVVSELSGPDLGIIGHSKMTVDTMKKQCPRCVDQDDTEEGLLHWFFGLQYPSSIFPLIVSHSLTLLAGLYIGYRRASYVQPSPSVSSSGSPSAAH